MSTPALTFYLCPEYIEETHQHPSRKNELTTKGLEALEQCKREMSRVCVIDGITKAVAGIVFAALGGLTLISRGPITATWHTTPNVFSILAGLFFLAAVSAQFKSSKAFDHARGYLNGTCQISFKECSLPE